MKRSTICLLSLLFALAATAAWAAADAHETQEDLAGKLIRLHVLANSDSQTDQAVKLRVRDAVLEAAEAQLEDCATVEAAEAQLTELLPELEAMASSVLAENGFDYPVQAALTWEDYPTREYDTFTLPAGRYLSLRVRLGEGAGQNWWCVVFPPLCLGSVSETTEETAALGGLSQEEVALMTGETEGYVVKFKAIELWESFRGWVEGR